MPLPTLQSARLTLRSFNPSDAANLVRLAGAREVAATTLRIPHPYRDADAEHFIAGTKRHAESGQAVVFAIELNEARKLVGAIGLEIQSGHRHAELGYWIGVPYWGNGYATEAGHAILRYGFESLHLHRIWAMHFVENPASGKVLRKLGMKHEGTLRGHVLKWEVFHDAPFYGILHSEWPPKKE